MLHQLKSMEKQRYRQPVKNKISTLSSFCSMLVLISILRRRLDGVQEQRYKQPVSKEISDLVQLLLDAGADVNVPPTRLCGRTALQAACEEGNFQLAQLLLNAGADVNAPPAEAYGIIALQEAC